MREKTDVCDSLILKVDEYRGKHGKCPRHIILTKAQMDDLCEELSVTRDRYIDIETFDGIQIAIVEESISLEEKLNEDENNG